MKRILSLGAATIFALTLAPTIGARCCCCYEVTYGCVNTSVVVGGVRWVLYKGVVLHSTMLTGSVVLTRRLLNDRYAALLRFTSETTPVVAGYIIRILLDDRNRLWAFNKEGGASMYDGVSWETFPHQGRAKVSDWDEGNTADVIMRNGMIRIATSGYVDEIDVQHLKRTRLVDVGNGTGYATFGGFDIVHLYGNISLSFIDLLADTASIVCERETTEDSSSIFHIVSLVPVVTGLASIAIFPNPASHHATIELATVPAKETTAMLVDATGNTVYTLPLACPATLLDLAALPVGMYTVVLTTEHLRTARSLIVQR